MRSFDSRVEVARCCREYPVSCFTSSLEVCSKLAMLGSAGVEVAPHSLKLTHIIRRYNITVGFQPEYLLIQAMPPKKAQATHRTLTSKPPSSVQSKRSASHAAKSSRKPESNSSTVQSEQEILTIFRRTFSHAFTNTLPQTLQEVKGHLYNRDYLKAFGSEEYLQAYVVRWSPSRALAYKRIFLDTCKEIRKVLYVEEEGYSKNAQIVCIGGGAGAEVVGIAAAVKELTQWGGAIHGEEGAKTLEQENEQKSKPNASGEADRKSENHQERKERNWPSLSRLHVTAIDIAFWANTISSLVSSLTQTSEAQPPFISPDLFSATFHQGDVLSASTESLITKSTSLITILFTTNELFTQSTSSATAFLSSLGGRVSSGALLMVVESAGSYSMVKVGGKEYPMPWLLDLILVGRQGGEDGNGVWEKIVSEDSNWYRLPKEGLRYPIELEDMRYLVRVYQRV